MCPQFDNLTSVVCSRFDPAADRPAAAFDRRDVTIDQNLSGTGRLSGTNRSQNMFEFEVWLGPRHFAMVFQFFLARHYQTMMHRDNPTMEEYQSEFQDVSFPSALWCDHNYIFEGGEIIHQIAQEPRLP